MFAAAQNLCTGAHCMQSDLHFFKTPSRAGALLLVANFDTCGCVSGHVTPQSFPAIPSDSPHPGLPLSQNAKSGQLYHSPSHRLLNEQKSQHLFLRLSCCLCRHAWRHNYDYAHGFGCHHSESSLYLKMMTVVRMKTRIKMLWALRVLVAMRLRGMIFFHEMGFTLMHKDVINCAAVGLCNGDGECLYSAPIDNGIAIPKVQKIQQHSQQ